MPRRAAPSLLARLAAPARALRRLLRALARRRAAAAESSDARGRRGERAAVRCLKAAGYRVLARRHVTAGGEVDVVALDGETLVLVEVKATATDGAPRDRVDARKRRRLALARAALARDPRLARRPYRLDVVEVTLRGRRAACRLLRGAAALRRAHGARKACAATRSCHNRAPADRSPR